jgi:DNA-binding NtrC family response regulator
MDVLARVREMDPDISVIMVTGYPSSRTTVQSVKLGAFDYLPKPFTPRELQAAVVRALKRRQPKKEADSSDKPWG